VREQLERAWWGARVAGRGTTRAQTGVSEGAGCSSESGTTGGESTRASWRKKEQSRAESTHVVSRPVLVDAASLDVAVFPSHVHG
jgi:hypothetical protein